MGPEESVGGRAALEQQITACLRVMTAESEQIGRAFAAAHDVRPTDFRALLHVMVAETAGEPVTSASFASAWDFRVPPSHIWLTG